MRKTWVVVLGAVAAVSGIAEEPESQLLRLVEGRLGLQAPYEQVYGEVNQNVLALLCAALMNTPEHYIHNFNGAEGNQVFVHKDGHREAVFDASGEPVTDCVNGPSYNYYDALDRITRRSDGLNSGHSDKIR